MCYCFASSYWGIVIAASWEIAIPRFQSSAKCCKLLLFCIKPLGECNCEAPVLCQAIGELQFAGSYFASSCWGLEICRVLRCVKLLGNSNLQGVVPPQAIEGLRFKYCTNTSFVGFVVLGSKVLQTHVMGAILCHACSSLTCAAWGCPVKDFPASFWWHGPVRLTLCI